MAEKLRSILRRIHWSLALKAAVFALAWWWLPYWLFFLISLYLYFVPLFRTGKLIIPFFVLLLLAYLQAPGAPFTLLFGAIFYFILLIKDLLLLDRRSAYELLVFMLSFLLFRDFYMKFNAGIGGAALFYSFLTAAAAALLFHSFLRCFREDMALGPGVRRAAVWLFFLLLWQILIAGLFLPVDFIYQSVAAFLVTVLFIDLVPEYLFGVLSRTKALTAATAVFALFVVVLASARLRL